MNGLYYVLEPLAPDSHVDCSQTSSSMNELEQ
jgi:hypothetical protein